MLSAAQYALVSKSNSILHGYILDIVQLTLCCDSLESWTKQWLNGKSPCQLLIIRPNLLSDVGLRIWNYTYICTCMHAYWNMCSMQIEKAGTGSISTKFAILLRVHVQCWQRVLSIVSSHFFLFHTLCFLILIKPGVKNYSLL